MGFAPVCRTSRSARAGVPPMDRVGPLAAALIAGLCPIATPSRAGEVTVIYALGGRVPAPPAHEGPPDPGTARAVEVTGTRGPKIIVIDSAPATPVLVRSPGPLA